MFDADKTRMIGLPYGKKTDNMLSRFHLIPERHKQTDGRTDRQTDRIAISISRVSVLTRDKNLYRACKSTGAEFGLTLDSAARGLVSADRCVITEFTLFR